MQIEIKSVNTIQKTSANGKSYSALELSYKNGSSGKIEGKTLMPFGGNKDSYDVLKSANPGQVFEVKAAKNQQGFWDWVSATPTEGFTATQGSTPGRAASGSTKSTYETPEERAQRQILIVRQSSLSSAVASLSAGAKAAIDPKRVIEVAKEFEDYVFGRGNEISGTEALTEMDDDIPY